VEPLATFLLARVGARPGRALRVSPEVLRLLLEHDWPGNVRELENVLEFAVAVCKGQTILPDDLPGEVSADYVEPHEIERRAPVVPPNGSNGSRAGDTREIDFARVRGALEACQWRRHKAAEVLGISRTTLWRRMRDLGLA